MQKKIGAALVVGAGISGIRSALDLAEMGYGVTLIDRAQRIGGTLAQLDYQFPSDHCGMCKMLPLVERDASSQYCLRRGLFHENIDILLGTELVGVEGEPGKFQVTPTSATPGGKRGTLHRLRGVRPRLSGRGPGRIQRRALACARRSICRRRTTCPTTMW